MTRSREIDHQESIPDCPQCEHNLFVHHGRLYEWFCEGCSEPFGRMKYHPALEGDND